MQISIIGDNAPACTSDEYNFSRKLGNILAQKNYTIICGGMGGVMEAVCRGAKENNPAAMTVGILPVGEKSTANPYVEVIIPTGMGIARNTLVVNSGDAVISIGGGSGTLAELAFAWQLGKPVLAVNVFDGWSKELANKRLDSKRQDKIESASSLEEIITWLHNLPQNADQ